MSSQISDLSFPSSLETRKHPFIVYLRVPGIFLRVPAFTAEELCFYVCSSLNIPRESFFLTVYGQVIEGSDALCDDAIVELHYRIPGGAKGQKCKSRDNSRTPVPEINPDEGIVPGMVKKILGDGRFEVLILSNNTYYGQIWKVSKPGRLDRVRIETSDYVLIERRDYQSNTDFVKILGDIIHKFEPREADKLIRTRQIMISSGDRSNSDDRIEFVHPDEGGAHINDHHDLEMPSSDDESDDESMEYVRSLSRQSNKSILEDQEQPSPVLSRPGSAKLNRVTPTPLVLETVATPVAAPLENLKIGIHTCIVEDHDPTVKKPGLKGDNGIAYTRINRRLVEIDYWLFGDFLTFRGISSEIDALREKISSYEKDCEAFKLASDSINEINAAIKASMSKEDKKIFANLENDIRIKKKKKEDFSDFQNKLAELKKKYSSVNEPLQKELKNWNQNLHTLRSKLNNYKMEDVQQQLDNKMAELKKAKEDFSWFSGFEPQYPDHPFFNCEITILLGCKNDSYYARRILSIKPPKQMNDTIEKPETGLNDKDFPMLSPSPVSHSPVWPNQSRPVSACSRPSPSLDTINENEDVPSFVSTGPKVPKPKVFTHNNNRYSARARDMIESDASPPNSA